MPTVTGKIAQPDLTGRGTVSATIELVDEFGQPTRAFKTDTNETLVGAQPLTLADGTYSVVVPGNTGLYPTGTRYRRRVHLPGGIVQDDYLIVPASGGPYQEEDILAGPLAPLPAATPSNELDWDEITVDNSAVAITALQLAPLANLSVTVPDVDQPVWIEATCHVSYSVADAAVSIYIGPTGLGTGAFSSCIASASGRLWTATASVLTLNPRARIAPQTPGTYQLYATGPTGNLTLRGNAATALKSSLSVLGV